MSIKVKFDGFGLRVGVSAAAVIALLAANSLAPQVPGFVGLAKADTHESGGKKGPKAGGGEDGHEDGHDDGGDSHDDSHEEGSKGKGPKGGEEGGGNPLAGNGDGEGKGADGKGADGKGKDGSRPAWAGEGIPEVELGRLNVARSPSHVLDRAFAEAMATVSPEMVSFYSLPYDQMIKKLSKEWDTISIIDSPLQNLSLLRDTLSGGPGLTAVGVVNDRSDLMAVYLGVASDKTVPISYNTVLALTTILGYTLTKVEMETLAVRAEAVRAAVLQGHG